MTRRPASAPPASQPRLRPLAPPRNRTAQVSEQIAGEIAAGRFVAGARLPTEQEMMAALGVSRTVIREAVAGLRADGLVVTRQGLGAFVAADPERQRFRILPGDLASVADVLDIMELRMAVESETAGLAVERGSAAQLKTIAAALEAIAQAIARGEAAIEEDAAFHRAIARASGNSRFVMLLEYLGRFIIPRQTIRTTADRRSEITYMQTFQAEHRAINRAIQKRDARQARKVMRVHLLNSRERYRLLARAAEVRENR